MAALLALDMTSKMQKTKDRTKKLNVLFTCIGRRVSLLKSFVKAAGQLRISVQFFGTDANQLSPALQLCDKKLLAKPISSPAYIPDLLKIVKKNQIKLLIPTIDTDLVILSENRSKFAKLGCHILVSEPNVIDICQDKRKTYRFLLSSGFDTPETVSVRTALSRKKLTWPCFVKPWDGYASRGNAIVRNRKELLVFGKRVPNAICQEFIKGIEYTCDVYVDFDMQVRCVVPRRRIETRAGEVSKSQVVKNEKIMARAAELTKALKAGPGVITVQLILTAENKIKFIEINPRFGGGVPLAIKAGANFPKWILQEILGLKPTIGFDGFKDNLIMLRYDNEVWLENHDV